MREGWTETTLGDIAEYINGYPFKPGDLGDDGTAVIRIKQLLDPMEKFDRTTVDVPERCVLSNGDIVFSWSGTLAVRVWNRGTAFLNQHLFRVVEKTGVSHEWLPLVIDHAIKDLVEKSHGTTMKHITKQTLLPHQVLLPPLVEQKRIVDVVSSVDAYIDALQQQADSARTARNAVLHELLSAGGDDWTETTLGDLCEIYQPETISKAKMDESAPYVVYGANGPVGRYSRFNHEEPEVVVTCRGATCGVVNMTPPNCWITGNAMVVKPRDNRSVKGFLFWALQVSVDVQATISGSAQPQITRTGLAPSKICVPPIAEQMRIVEIVSFMDDVIRSTEQALADAKNLRSGLLSDLLSGEHEIPASYDKLMGAA